MNSRIKQFRLLLAKHKIDAYLVTSDPDITYLTNFPASESWLLVCPQKTYYITDFRYILEARAGLKGIVVQQYTKSIFETLFQLVKREKIKSLGYDDRHISVALFRQLKKAAPKAVKLRVYNQLVEQLRIVKEKSEVQQIRKALDLNLKAYQFIKKYVRPGATEQQILLKLEQYVKGKGAEFSFEPIVASGPNSCLPHAKVTRRKVRNNEPVLIDMGIDIKGYKSDLTRMFFLGKIPQIIKDINAIVAEAQQRAIAKVKPGMVASEIDQEARNHLKKHRLSKYFGHSLGHGVGLEIHEAPRISQVSPIVLKENMVFTVEPAVYIPNKFGIRIEDMVLVTKNGCEVLSRS